ncbi:MAG: Ig-like domain-containing protein, partial [Bacillales bacterium]|nr:Ig-like domain-containing protein [Bacillales bacterium]
SYLTKKVLYAGLNPFYSLSSFSPSYNISVNSSTSYSIETYQKTIFEDSISTFSIVPQKDIFTIYQSNKKYDLNSAVSYNENTPYLTGTSSSYSISANNGGINEFEVQSISIEGDTHDVPVDTVLQLTGTINDINKSYYKNYTWQSEDTSIATVDQTGLVKGIALGSTNIVLSCGGVSQTYLINVIDAVNVIGVSSVNVTCTNGNSSGATFKDGSYTFEAKIIGEDSSTLSLSKVSKVVWTFRNESSIPGDRVYFGKDSNNKLTTVSDTLSVQVTLAGGAAANSSLGSADVVNVVCTVTDIKGNVKPGEFKIVNDNNTCFEKGTTITTNRGLIPVEELKSDDLIKSYNHESGKYEYKPIAALIDHGENIYKVISLDFSDGSNIGFIACHGLFDLDENQYVDINEVNYLNYIGHRFAKGLGDEYKEITLIKASIIEKITRSYTVLSSENINCEANGILNITSVLKGVYNIFEYDENHNFDTSLMNKDIEQYGIYTYEDFKDRIDEKKFYDLGFKYFKVSIGKGLLTDEILQFYIDWFYECIEDGTAIIY